MESQILQPWDPENLQKVRGRSLDNFQQVSEKKIGHGEVRVYRGTGVSRGVRRTTWERSLKNRELQISCFEEFLDGGNVLGLVPASLPHTLGYACTFYAPTSPPPKKPCRTVPVNFGRLSGLQRHEIFYRLFGISGPKGQRDLCKSFFVSHLVL